MRTKTKSRFIELVNLKGEALAHMTANRGHYATWVVCEANLPKYENKKIIARIVEYPIHVVSGSFKLYHTEKLKIYNSHNRSFKREEDRGALAGRVYINTDVNSEEMIILKSVELVFPTRDNASDCLDPLTALDEIRYEK